MKISTEKIEFKNLLPEHAEQVAALHIANIRTGFLISLGPDFLTCLYNTIAQSQWGFGTVAEKNGKVIAYVAYSTHLGKLYKTAILRKGLTFAVLLVRKMFSIKRIIKAIETLLYPIKTANMNLPSAELLSVAVDPQEQGKGLGTKLIKESFQNCKDKGINRIKVLIAEDNIKGNNLYLKLGFKQFSRILSHGIPSYVYLAQVDSPKMKQF